MKKSIHHDIVSSVVAFLMALFILYQALTNMPESAALFPKIISGCLILLSAVVFYNGLKKNKKLNEDVAAGKEGSGDFHLKQYKLFGISAVFIAIYIACINIIGFYVSTAAFMVLFMMFLKVKKPLTLLFVTVCMDAFVYFVFTIQLNVPLPNGLFF